jgi:DNA-binding transcriptional ArsR family regulator
MTTRRASSPADRTRANRDRDRAEASRAAGSGTAGSGAEQGDGDGLWRALASPWRRQLLDLLRANPRTTGELAAAIPELSRFAVMQHLDVLTGAGLVLVRRRGRYRINHLNPVPLRRFYERWVQPMADSTAAGLLALQRTAEATPHVPADSDSLATNQNGETTMTTIADEVRTVRLACELSFRATAERLFHVLTQQSLDWFPHTYGGDRVRKVVLEPRIGGAHYEDWGDGAGHLYGQVTVYDPPRRYATRGRIMPGTILDTEYEITETGDGVVLNVVKVAVGAMTEEEAESIGVFGDLRRFEEALRKVVESPDG